MEGAAYDIRRAVERCNSEVPDLIVCLRPASGISARSGSLCPLSRAGRLGPTGAGARRQIGYVTGLRRYPYGRRKTTKLCGGVRADSSRLRTE